MTDATIIEPAPVAPAVSAVSWPAIFAGAVAALAVSLICVALGAGFSAGTLGAWPNMGHGLTTFSRMTGVWLIVTQWVASAVGGYLTGRLRTRWHELHTHEVFFRDTANGLITWALATVVVALVGALVANAGASGAAAAALETAQRVPADVAAEAAAVAAKAGAAYSVFAAIGMLVGAFIACVAAALGGQQRDEHA